jgi:hypothetical protein
LGLRPYYCIRGTTPLSTQFGYDRGTPIDRYYIENFLATNSNDIRGRTLELGDDAYTSRFGGLRATRRDILHVHSRNPAATIVGDLSAKGTLEPGAYDCLVITQGLHLIYNMRAAVEQMHSGLREGGVLLLTSPGISQISRDEWATNWFWSITCASARRLFGEVFGSSNVEVNSHGNVFAAVAFLRGLATEEVPKAKLNVVDDAYPVTVTVRATKKNNISDMSVGGP